MAASISLVKTLLQGARLAPVRLRPAPCRCLQLQTAPNRPLHVTSQASLCASRTEPPKSQTQNTTNTGRRPQEEEDEDEGPEYIPQRKAKNPMMKIGYAWMIGLPTGIIGFVLAKREVDKNRLKQLKIRQRMRMSNEGDYEGSRYRHQEENVKLDQ